MGRGRQLGMGICVELRSMAGQRRVVCFVLFVALITFTAFVVYINSGNLSEDDATFFQGQLAPASLLGNPATTEDARHFTNSTRDGDSQLTSTVGDEVEAKANDLKVEEVSLDKSILRSLNVSANSTSSDFKVGGKSGKNVSTSSNLKSASEGRSQAVDISNLLKESFQNNSKEAEASGEQVLEEATATSASKNTSNLQNPKGRCDVLQGKWTPDSHPPMYNSSTCRYIQAFQNCVKNGRPDVGYVYWRWKPDQCEVPRVDARAFLTAMRNRSIVFAGDSIARNQYQSLLCVLAQVEDPKDVYHSEDDKNHIYLFQSYNFTLTIHWAPYLVRVEDKSYTWPDNKTEIVTHVYLDELADVWVKAAVGADILHLSTGQWWYKRAIYLEKRKPVGCHADPPCFNEIGFAPPYGTALANILKGSLSIPGFSGTTVYRSLSPDHFEGGDWDTGGSCNRTIPGGVPLSHQSQLIYGVQIEQFKNVTEELDMLATNRLKLLDITNLAQSRADAHPNGYRTPKDRIADKTPHGIRNDCLHWCLPGPIDTWNDLLVESVRDVIFK